MYIPGMHHFNCYDVRNVDDFNKSFAFTIFKNVALLIKENQLIQKSSSLSPLELNSVVPFGLRLLVQVLIFLLLKLISGYILMIVTFIFQYRYLLKIEIEIYIQNLILKLKCYQLSCFFQTIRQSTYISTAFRCHLLQMTIKQSKYRFSNTSKEIIQWKVDLPVDILKTTLNRRHAKKYFFRNTTIILWVLSHIYNSSGVMYI